MTAFWIAAAGLIALAWLMLWPAARRKPGASAIGGGNVDVLKEQIAALDADLAAGRVDAAEHARLRTEIARRVLEEDTSEPVLAAPAGSPRRNLWLIALAVPVVAFGLYATLGNRDALVAASQPAASEPSVSAQDIETMLTTVQQRLETETDLPRALQGWTMLGRTYAAMQRFPEARRAYDRAIVLAPNDAQVLADQADVIAMVQGQRMEGEPTQLMERALKIDPRNLKALALTGSAAYEKKDFKTAIDRWQAARELAPPGSDFAAGLDRSLADARAAGGVPAPVSPAASAVAAAAAPPGASLEGRVSLAPSLAAKVAPGDTVFVFARAAQGPRMPLAIMRRTVSELPLQFKLDDSMAMSPEMKLSKFDKVVVVARISRTGSAMPEPGDLQGQSAVLAPGAGGIALTIDSVQP